MTNYEKITASPGTLGAFLAALPVAGGPWDTAFHQAFCDHCGLEDCDPCPHEAEKE